MWSRPFIKALIKSKKMQDKKLEDKLFVFNLESKEISYLCKRDCRLKKLIQKIGPISYKLYEDGYSFLIHEIIEQMLSAKAGKKIFHRLVELCGGIITPEKISNLTFEQIKSIGTANSKVTFIQEITNSILNGSLDLEKINNMDKKMALSILTSFKGIGNWTANMYLLFCVGNLDVLPYDDVAFLQTFKWLYNKKTVSKKVVIQMCKKWSPYSSLASRYFYIALDTGLLKTSISKFLNGDE